MTTRCPIRNLLVERAHLDDDKFEEIYETLWSANDFDENVRIFNIRLSIARCFHTTSRGENFHTYISHKDELYGND